MTIIPLDIYGYIQDRAYTDNGIHQIGTLVFVPSIQGLDSVSKRPLSGIGLNYTGVSEDIPGQLYASDDDAFAYEYPAAMEILVASVNADDETGNTYVAGNFYRLPPIINEAVLELQANKSNTGHTHTSSDITDFSTATNSLITSKINDLLNGAGSAYNTLKELQDLIVADESTASALAITVAAKVDKTTTVNGHALSGNVTVTKSDVGLGNVDNTADSAKTFAASQITSGTKTNTFISDFAAASRAAFVGYDGTTSKAGAFPIFKSGTVASGVIAFHLTSDGTSGGTALFPNGPIMASANAFVSDAAASYQMAVAWSNGNKTVTITANKLTTSNILTGILGQAQANGSVVNFQVWGN